MVTGHIGLLQTGVGYNSGSKLILITFFMAKLYKKNMVGDFLDLWLGLLEVFVSIVVCYLVLR